jgi:predicted ATPase
MGFSELVDQAGEFLQQRERVSYRALKREFALEELATQVQAEALLDLAAKQGFTLRTAQGSMFRGWVLAMQGQGKEGIAQLRQGLADFQATGAEFYRPGYLALLAEAYEKEGQYEEGLAVLVEALDIVNKTEERFYEVELYRLYGELTLQKDFKVQSFDCKVEESPKSGVRSRRVFSKGY